MDLLLVSVLTLDSSRKDNEPFMSNVVKRYVPLHLKAQYWKAHNFYRSQVGDIQPTPDWWDRGWARPITGTTVPGVEMLIFSKNRACQLDQLVRSLVEHVEELNLYRISVLYTAENGSFLEGYRIVQKQFPFLRFVEQRRENTIGQQIEEILADGNREFFCMLVDDDILIRRLSLYCQQFETFRSDLRIASLSVRLSPSVTYCQPLTMAVTPSRISKRGVFHWYVTPRWKLLRNLLRSVGYDGVGAGDWGVSMSMDGNFFRLREFREYFRRIPSAKEFGDIEATMCRTPIPKEYGICFDQPKLVNVPLNSVRGDYKYPNMEITPEYLNELFLSGRRLDYSGLRSTDGPACHLEIAPQWDVNPIARTSTQDHASG